MRVISKENLYTGILFFIIGLIFLLLGSNYNFGTAAEMGPGFFPVVSSITLIIISIVLVLGSIKLK